MPDRAFTKEILDQYLKELIKEYRMNYGYARVSSIGQKISGNSLEDQISQLKTAGCREENIYKEQFTGATMDRPEFDRVLEKLKSGDKLIVTKLDRIARTATSGFETVKQLLDRGVSVHVLNMELIDNTPTGRLILHIMLSFAEFEREMIKERTAAGKAIARQKPGYKEGRPKRITPEIIKQIKKGVSWEKLGISRATWYRYNKKNV